MKNNHIIKRLKEIIQGTKYENKVFVAGGFVRDYIMGRVCHDIDLVVVGDNLNCGRDLAWYMYRIGAVDSKPVEFPRFGTAQIIMNREPIEIVAARKETYNFKDRNPIVEVGTLQDDVNRRDFTINAILYNISADKIVDLNGGIKDIENRIIRTTSDPDIIFAEDPLRIMRAIRFAARLGFDIEEKTKAKVYEFVPWLKNISNERIRDEFVKIILSDNCRYGLQMLKESKILEMMIPEFKDLYAVVSQGKHHVKSAWEHTLDVVERTPSTVNHRLAALLHDVGKAKTMTITEDGNIHFNGHQHVSRSIAVRFMTKFKFENSQIEQVRHGIAMHMNFLENMLPKTIRKFINEMGKETFLFALDIAEADSWGRDRLRLVRDVRQFVLEDKYIREEPSQMKMPVNGDMIMEKYNIKPGKEVGRLLTIEKEYLFEFPEASIDDIWNILDNSKYGV